MSARVALAVLIVMMSGSAWAAHATLSYQGQLQNGGVPYTGDANLEFRLFDQETVGSQIGPTVTENDWPVIDGLFQVELDFGAVFDGGERWLEVTVDGEILTPRQAVRPAPVALYALAGSDWQLNGSNVYYSAGFAGIGTATPAAPLEIVSDSLIAQPQLLLTEAQDDFARMSFANTENDRFWATAALTRDDNTAFDRFNVFHSTLGDLLTVSGAGEGSVGIRNGNPTSSFALDVDATTASGSDGGILIRADSTIGLPHLRLLETGTDFARINFTRFGSSRLWALAGYLDEGSDSGLDRFNLYNSGGGDLIRIHGNGQTGLGIDPVSRLTVRSDSQWSPAIGNGRGDLYVGDGSVGLSMGVALGGGGRGVSRIWTNGGVENLFLGSAAYGTSLAIFPGQVGVNTTGPQNTLDVNGGVRVGNLAHGGTVARFVRAEPDGDLTGAAVTQYLSLAPVAFVPELSGATFQRVGFLRVSSGSMAFAAPVHLPDGAIVTEIRVWYEDMDSTNNLRVMLCRGTLGTNNCSPLGTITTDGTTSGVTDSAVIPTGPAIDNAASHYNFRVYTVDAGGSFVAWSPDLRLWAVRLTYAH